VAGRAHPAVRQKTRWWKSAKGTGVGTAIEIGTVTEIETEPTMEIGGMAAIDIGGGYEPPTIWRWRIRTVWQSDARGQRPGSGRERTGARII